jgi:protein-disulfide isomerase
MAGLITFALAVVGSGCQPRSAETMLEVGHVFGSDTAPVTVIEFSDFGCPFCRMFSVATFPELRREYVDTGQVRWIYVPIVTGGFRNGAEAARAGECAAEQGQFAAMKEQIYLARADWTDAGRPEEVFAGIARELRLDAERFATCYRENTPADRIRYNNLTASAAGVRATPTFIIDGRIIEGALPIESFRGLLDERVAASR